MIISAIGFLAAIFVIVFAHEFGHYLAAKACLVHVEEFSIGFGREIFSVRDLSGTIWKIGLIPLGGYVKMFGDADIASSSDFARLESMSFSQKKKAFALKTPIQRIFIAVAGPAANFLLALVIFTAFYRLYGALIVSNQISEVDYSSPAYISGIIAGDKIESIDGVKTDNFSKLHSYIALRPNQLLTIKIKRDGEILYVKVRAGAKDIVDSKKRVQTTIGFIGVKSSEPKHMHLSLYESVKASMEDVYSLLSISTAALKQMLLGERSTNEIRGIITMAEQSGESLNSGITSFLLYIAFISVNIGFVNLLPIPLLDGGHIVLCIFEIVTKARPSEYASRLFNKIGIVFVIFMFVISSSNDISALF
ncbi:MAG: M50 family metallopeptidase [Rickettsiaceae bacterium]|nr:M50 family metallopeptidase [Rickettsiaceae bacterium]